MAKKLKNGEGLQGLGGLGGLGGAPNSSQGGFGFPTAPMQQMPGFNLQQPGFSFQQPRICNFLRLIHGWSTPSSTL